MKILITFLFIFLTACSSAPAKKCVNLDALVLLGDDEDTPLSCSCKCD